MQDLPKAVESGTSGLPPSLSNRVEFMPHDFFTEQPVKDADVYLFRWIFHNWSDGYCINILRNLIPALKNGAMIVINDNCLPEPGTMGQWQEERLRYVAFRISHQIVQSLFPLVPSCLASCHVPCSTRLCLGFGEA